MTGDIFIYGGIGTDERNQEVSFENVRKQITNNSAASELIVHIISPGGDVFEGYSIYNALKNSGKKITTHIEGTCASIATLIAGAGDKIIMNKTAQFMIHNPHVTGIDRPADSKILRNVAGQLDQIKTLLINVYKHRTGLTQEELWALYDNETWLTADEAKQKGFIDESVHAIKAVAKVDLTKINSEMENTNALKGLINRFSNLLKFKNEVKETLEDGTAIIVMTDDGDFTGKQVIYEDGSPVPAGEHKLVTGKVLVVDGNSVITEVKEAEAPQDDMEKQKEIDALKAQLAEAQAKATEAEAKLTSVTAEAAMAKADSIKFQNRIETIEKDFIKLKEEALKTIGDPTPPQKGAAFKNSSVKDFDPMGEEALKYFRNRKIVTNED
jgi:ATP-dependent Clp protease protease subunit